MSLVCLVQYVFNVHQYTAHAIDISLGWTSVFLSVRPSHAGIMSKRLNLSSNLSSVKCRSARTSISSSVGVSTSSDASRAASRLSQ